MWAHVCVNIYYIFIYKSNPSIYIFFYTHTDGHTWKEKSGARACPASVAATPRYTTYPLDAGGPSSLPPSSLCRTTEAEAAAAMPSAPTSTCAGGKTAPFVVEARTSPSPEASMV